jgi:hypothetical protein
MKSPTVRCLHGIIVGFWRSVIICHPCENLDLGALAFLSGILVLIFAQRMKRHMRIRGAMYPKLLGGSSETFPRSVFQRFLTEWQRSFMIFHDFSW